MIRAGLIWNQHSHRNRGAGAPPPLPEDVIDIVPEQPSHLMAGLKRLAGDGVELVVIDGGDGTIREVLTRLPEAYDGKLPNGTSSVSDDIRIQLDVELLQAAAPAAGAPGRTN